MAIHKEILETALGICRGRPDWSFNAAEIVLRLPHLNESSVRTHIVSRCCVNAPKNHPHKWDYFERIGRGVYRITRKYRKSVPATATDTVAETAPVYDPESRPARDTIHAIAYREKSIYVAECVEIAVATQGATLDQLVSNLCEAIALHLEGENLRSLGLAPSPRLSLSYEIPLLRDVTQT